MHNPRLFCIGGRHPAKLLTRQRPYVRTYKVSDSWEQLILLTEEEPERDWLSGKSKLSGSEVFATFLRSVRKLHGDHNIFIMWKMYEKVLRLFFSCLTHTPSPMFKIHPSSIYCTSIWQQLIFASQPMDLLPLFQAMRKHGITPSADICTSIVLSAVRSRYEYCATFIFHYMMAHGLVTERACFALYNLYLSAGDFQRAKQIFDHVRKTPGLLQHPRAFYSRAMLYLVRFGIVSAARDVYSEYLTKYANSPTLQNWVGEGSEDEVQMFSPYVDESEMKFATFLLQYRSGYSGVSELAEAIHDFATDPGDPYMGVYFSLFVEMCHKVRRDNVALKFFHEMRCIGLVPMKSAYLAMVRILLSVKGMKISKKVRIISSLFTEMESNLIKIPLYAFNAVLKCFSYHRDVQRFERMWMKMLSFDIKPNIESIHHLVILLIECYGRSNGEITGKVLEKYGLSDPTEAVAITNRGSRLLQAFSSLSPLCYYLVHIYARLGRVDDALQVYNLIVEEFGVVKDDLIYTARILLFSACNLDPYMVVQEMKADNIQPNFRQCNIITEFTLRRHGLIRGLQVFLKFYEILSEHVLLRTPLDTYFKKLKRRFSLNANPNTFTYKAIYRSMLQDVMSRIGTSVVLHTLVQE
eukprot:TRINITY_DN12695_c0_g1_i1.p1 TRINITY_DN12695_c0_g1~~TRINITY_DN12695_c0_g1_i1.p1  ORF type:complete len:637 (-),score=63.47 TRINITY_DN12695_c0_g1_i1:171-2081(-)